MESAIDLPVGYEWDDLLTLGPETQSLTRLLWPRFMIEDGDMPQDELSTEMTADEIARRFRLWGVRHTASRRLVAYAHAALVAVDLKSEGLPEEGWRFAVESVFAGGPPNCLCLLVTNIDPALQGRGISQAILARSKRIALESGLKTVIGPVRPVSKSDYPALSLEDYACLQRADGSIYDPWLRVHVRLGARILNVCHRSVIVRASVAQWRLWTNLSLTAPGRYELPNGLAPLEIDPDMFAGVYYEPNIWVRYDL